MLKKETKRKILSFFVPIFGAFLLRLIYFTCKVNFHGKDFPKDTCIYATWHGELIMTPFCYNKLQDKNRIVSVITSPHFDGQLIGKVIEKLASSESIAGSSSKDGAKALIRALRVLKKPNYDLAIAPDGPRGPRHVVAQGIVALSQRLHVPIVTVNCKASSYWEFKSWDKMFLPKPFSKIDFYVGESFLLDGLEMKEAIKKVKGKLMENAHV